MALRSLTALCFYSSDLNFVSNVIIFLSSQKQRKAALRKERRKRKRQALAQARECGMKIAVLLILLSNVITCHNLHHKPD